MRYFSMFSGIGGFELGIQKVHPDWECIGHSEIDKYADKIYMKHFNSKNYGNVRDINPDDLPGFDMIVGGFPCQSFSIAGKRGGIKYDTRGTLFREIIRIAKSKRPRIIWLENVKGLLSSAEGWDFYVIQDSLAQLRDFRFLEWQVLNTKDYLPQNRERVFIIGHFGKESGQKVFPIRKRNKTNRKSIYRECNTLLKNYGKLSGDSTKIQTDKGVRIFTEIECERLQGYPDKYTEGISDSQRYKCLGNAVSVPVISVIAENLK